MDIRKPAVAGTFYSGDSIQLKEEIRRCFLHPLGPRKEPTINPDGKQEILGLVSPHAGYMYSGPAACNGFYHLAQDQKPTLVIMIGPNHSSYVSPAAASTEEKWETPLGSVRVNQDKARKIISLSSGVIEDNPLSHKMEHSLEVQLPFLQYIYGNDFEFIPICMVDQSLETSLEVGEAIAMALSDRKENVVIIASTDFTHYESHEAARQKDKQAIQAILSLDCQELFSVVQKHSISMCGVGPVMAMLTVCRVGNARQGKLLTYYTSGDITGDKEHVVGYGSIKITK